MPRRNAVKRWLRGALCSWTVNYGLLISVLGYVQTQDKFITRYLGEEGTGVALFIVGLLIVALRAKTNVPLNER